MKNKEKKYFYYFTVLLISIAGFFVSLKNCLAEDSSTPNAGDVIINELMWMGSSVSTADEWIELKNTTTEEIDLSGWTIENGESSSKSIEIPTGYSIKSKGFFLITRKEWDETSLNFPEKLKNNEGITGISSMSLKDDGEELILEDASKKKVDTAWKNEEWPAGNKTIPKKSMERIDNNGVNSSSWQTCYELINNDPLSDYATPGEENSKKPEPKTYPSGIYISELLPNPKGSDEENEYIEFYNSTKNDIDLSEWILKDKSAGEYVFPKNSSIKASNFLVIYRKDFSFAINNSNESIYLFNPNEKIVSEVYFSDSAKEDISYAYDADSLTWRWTSKPTPREENQFDEILSGKIKIDNDIYTGISANFEVKASEGAKKFVWNFGDGHKSYLQKTTHKYEQAGHYQASLKITGDGEDNQYNFTVKVEDYEAPKVKITKFAPNPKGKDSENEWLEIKNDSKSKVNLKDWSVATGWKTLSNHPIKKDFIIKPGKTKKLTRKLCAFTLNNSQSKIELRAPDGEVVQKIKYNRKEDKIEEDEVFELNGKNWSSSAPQNTAPKSTGNISLNNPPDEAENTPPDIDQETDFNLSDQEIQASLGKYSPDPRWQAKKENQTKLLSYGYSPDPLTAPYSTSQGLVLGISTEKPRPIGLYEKYYTFTYPDQEKHWAVKLAERLWTNANQDINRVLNKIL